MWQSPGSEERYDLLEIKKGKRLFGNLFNSMNLSDLSMHVHSAARVPKPSVEGSLRDRKINFLTISSPFRFYLREQQGIALVVTLLALVLITAMVVEFSYAVYTGTNNLYNWRDSQRLSIMAKSGINVAAIFLKNLPEKNKRPYPGSYELPVKNPFEDFNGVITVRIEDEGSKLSLKSLVNGQGGPNEITRNSFRRLLEVLSLDTKIADKVVEWIIKKREIGLSSFIENKNNFGLNSVDELLLINGITRKDYDTLLPYITVYGSPDYLIINVNGAGKPVLMSIANSENSGFPIDEDRAERIIRRRELSLFADIGKFNDIAGTQLSTDRITCYIGSLFLVRGVAESGGVKRIIEMVFNLSAGKIEYWKEY
jgi:type II secretory pathway component PulK